MPYTGNGTEWSCDDCGKVGDAEWGAWITVWKDKNFALCMTCLIKRGMGMQYGYFLNLVEAAVCERYPKAPKDGYAKGQIPDRIRRQVLERDGFRCRYCGLVVDRPAMDHIIPERRGGPTSVDNLVAACVRCNAKKYDRTPEEAGMTLLPVGSGVQTNGP